MKFLNWPVPILLRTLAPAPSGVSIASKNFLMPLVLGSFALREGSSGGMTGRPMKDDFGAADIVALLCTCDIVVFVAVDVNRYGKNT